MISWSLQWTRPLPITNSPLLSRSALCFQNHSTSETLHIPFSDFIIPLFHFCYSQPICLLIHADLWTLILPFFFFNIVLQLYPQQTTNSGSLTNHTVFAVQLSTRGKNKAVIKFDLITILHIVASEWPLWTTTPRLRSFQTLEMWLFRPFIMCFSLQLQHPAFQYWCLFLSYHSPSTIPIHVSTQLQPGFPLILSETPL